jgi:hypothetical protein
MESRRVQFWALFCFFNINDWPIAIICKATPILFADDTSILVTSQNVYNFQNYLYTAFGQVTVVASKLTLPEPQQNTFYSVFQ